MNSRASSPPSLEAEISAERQRIDRTIEAIQHKLTPGQLIDEGLRAMHSDAADGPSGILKTIQANPLPSALAAVGLVWLALAHAEAQRRRLVERTGAGQSPALASTSDDATPLVGDTEAKA